MRASGPARREQASFIKPLLAEQHRHVSCVGAGRNRTHAVRVRVTGHRFRLSPTTLMSGVVQGTLMACAWWRGARLGT